MKVDIVTIFTMMKRKWICKTWKWYDRSSPRIFQLGDVVGSSGDVQSSVTASVRAGWRKFSELSQVLCGRVLSLKLKGRLYKSCIRSVMSYWSGCCAMKKVNTRWMQAAEMKMIRMTCGKMLCDGIPNGLLKERTWRKDN